MSSFIPLSIPNFEGNEQKYVNDAVEQGWVSTGGAYISKLEKSKIHGVPSETLKPKFSTFISFNKSGL